MSVRFVTVPGLTWASLDGSAENFLAQVVFEFSVFDGYDVTASGTGPTAGFAAARGVVIDNLENPTFVTVEFSGIVERVCPFTKVTLALPKRTAPIRFLGNTGNVFASFFTREFPGVPQAVNFYGALLSAQQGN